MTAPQDDPLILIENTLLALQTQIKSITNESIEVRATSKLHASVALEREVLNSCLGIKKQIAGLRLRIESELDSPDNFTGCIRGLTNDYLQEYDSEIDKLQAAFKHNHDYWYTQVQCAKNFSKVRAAEMTAAS